MRRDHFELALQHYMRIDGPSRDTCEGRIRYAVAAAQVAMHRRRAVDLGGIMIPRRCTAYEGALPPLLTRDTRQGGHARTTNTISKRRAQRAARLLNDGRVSCHAGRVRGGILAWLKFRC